MNKQGGENAWRWVSTCESFSAGVDSSQPLRSAKVGDLQDAAVRVDQDVIALRKQGALVPYTEG